ncbi:MAG TPA: hypothetical protein VMM76_25915 [Pirellulaceae bacterium]|nr:hypothetical protein [Pirellulaceae bacterium]
MGMQHSSILLIVYATILAPLCFADENLDTAPIVSALMDVAADADWEVRYAAYEALKSQPRSEQLLELFWRGLEDENLRIRRLSLDKIVELEGPTDKVLTRLISLQENRMKGIPGDLMAQAVQSHLIHIGAPALPYLLEAIKRDEVDHDTVSALGQIPLGEYQTNVTTQLTALLKSDNKDVRLAAVRSLQNIMLAEPKRTADAVASAEAKAQGLDPRYLSYYTKLLQKYDSNSDGSLTEDEWSKMSRNPAAADTDQDGKITVIEYAKWSMPPKKTGERK